MHLTLIIHEEYHTEIMVFDSRCGRHGYHEKGESNFPGKLADVTRATGGGGAGQKCTGVYASKKVQQRMVHFLFE